MLQQLPRLHSLLDPGLILGISENHDWSVEALRTLFEQTLEGLRDSSVVVFIDALDECDESEIRSMVSSFKNLGNLSAAEGVSFQGHDQDIISYLDKYATCKWDRDEIPEDAVGNFILSSSKGLAEVTRAKQDPTVQFIHESVRDFLLKDNGLRVILLDTSGDLSAESHDQLKKCCFQYTQSYWKENGLPAGDSKHQLLETRVLAEYEFHFLRYAVQNILYHANAAEEGHINQTRFFGSFPLANWIQHNNVFQDKEVRRHTTGASLLYLLAEYNFRGLIESHQGSQSCFDIEGERYGAPILAAMATGSRPTVWKLLKRETRDEPATSRLHSLCDEYKMEQRRKSGPWRDFKYNPKWSLLHYILQDQDLVVASFAMTYPQAYANMNFRTHGGETVFSVADQQGHDFFAVVKLLVDNGANTELPDKHGRTPLCRAAQKGNAAAVAFLLSRGANIEHNSVHGQTPLFYGTLEGNEESMRLLISAGANVATTDHFGQTLLFHAACRSTDSEAKIHLLVAQAVDILKVNNSGDTALTWSLKKGKATKTILQLLIDHGDTIYRTDSLGRTPLMLALNCHLSIFKELIDMGAEIDSVDNEGHSPLLVAVKVKAWDQAHLLIESGACTDVFDTLTKRTALSYAVTPRMFDRLTFVYPGRRPTNLNYDVVEALLIHGAAVDVADVSGRTPLSDAAQYGIRKTDFSRLLLDHGADVNRADDTGTTPLSYAAVSYDPEAQNCVQLLLYRGAIPDIVDGIGNTALSYAATDTVRALLSISL
uniref:KAP NTPase domain-containing protein n=1 Tax=Fusarium oxysporum (strain Fo5176) TaxID=660025 RepID=A0A0D2YAW6_FUSOF